MNVDTVVFCEDPVSTFAHLLHKINQYKHFSRFIKFEKWKHYADVYEFNYLITSS